MDREDARFADFADLVGNVKLLLIYLALVWVLGALGEELVYRGYLMNRIAGLFHRRAAWTVSLIAVSVAFGCAHLDQGSTGMVENILNGLLLGGLYLACGRNLAAPVITHAFYVTNSYPHLESAPTEYDSSKPFGICRLEKSGGSSLLTEPSPIRPILPLQIIIRHSHIGHPHVRTVVLDPFSGV